MLYRLFFIIVFLNVCQSMVAAKNRELGKQLLEACAEYDHAFLADSENDNESASSQWHKRNQKRIQAMIDLIRQGADVSVYDSSGQNALWLSMDFLCDSDPLYNTFIKELIGARSDNFSLEFGGSIFAQSETCVIEKLMSYGLKPQADDSGAILNAVYSKDNRMELLLNAGVLANNTSYDGMPLLMNSAEANNFAAVKALVGHVDVNERYPRTGQTALHLALINCGTNLNREYMQEKYELIDLLLEKGAKINIADKEGASPLVGAIKEQDAHNVQPNQELIDLIFLSGADPLQKDIYGLSALHYASHKGLTKLLAAMFVAIEKYQPEKLQAAQREAHLDVGQFIQKNTLYKELKIKAYNIYDFARKVLALFGAYHVVMNIKKCMNSRRRS